MRILAHYTGEEHIHSSLEDLPFDPFSTPVVLVTTAVIALVVWFWHRQKSRA